MSSTIGREQRSITLEANGRHLVADVWTSVGVVGGVIALALTGWDRLGPIIALLVTAAPRISAPSAPAEAYSAFFVAVGLIAVRWAHGP